MGIYLGKKKIAATFTEPGPDMLQTVVNTRGTADYLFYNYNGSLEPFKNLDLSKCTSAQYMFNECGRNRVYNNDLDTSNITNGARMFSGTQFEEITVNTDSMTAGTYMFSIGDSGKRLRKITLSNTSKMTTTDYMFSSNYNLLEINGLDTSHARNMSSMFYNCKVLKNFPEVDFSSATTITSMFSGCEALTSTDDLKLKNMGKFTTASYVFSSCTNLQYADLSNWPLYKVTQCNGLFSSCTKLETVKGIDLNNVTTYSNAGSIVYGCTNLTNLEIKNIRCDLQIGTGTTYGTKLTDESLVGVAREIIKQTASRALKVSTASNSRLDAIYVKLIEITDEMREQDPNIDAKFPCAVCESTDAGAMTLREYIVSKNRTIST